MPLVSNPVDRDSYQSQPAQYGPVEVSQISADRFPMHLVMHFVHQPAVVFVDRTHIPMGKQAPGVPDMLEPLQAIQLTGQVPFYRRRRKAQVIAKAMIKMKVLYFDLAFLGQLL